jgi:DnaK suppressor protein
MTTIDAEETWSDEELQSIREGLVDMAATLRTELAGVDADLAAVLNDQCNDDIDWADKQAGLITDTFRADNTRAVLEQTERVLARLDAGLYGVCEQCSGPITRARMQAFPRATCCITCLS